MRIFVAGGQGVIARRVVRQLAEQSVEVRVPVGRAERSTAAVLAGALPVPIDLDDGLALSRALADIDIVVNLAGEVPRPSRAWRTSAWTSVDREWRDTSRRLVEAMSSAGGSRFIQASTTLLYPDGGDDWIEESWPVSQTKVTAGAVEAEEQAQRLTADGQVGVSLRFGQVYAADSEATRSTLRAARRGLGNTVGTNDGYVSTIHADDAATAVIAALEVPAGVYNIVEDEPGTKAAQMDAIASALGIGRLNSTGAAIAALGGSRTRAMSRSHRVSNRRFRDVAGWRAQYPNQAEGWVAVVAATARRGRDDQGAV
ncbi:MAG: NAD(P)-dependent oxidoreductase [Candidatus Nanopelagicales bacterium]|nr:NAD(P)-dependent oxidoreductase [Candidatus Nanopelagicales bacterium]